MSQTKPQPTPLDDALLLFKNAFGGADARHSADAHESMARAMVGSLIALDARPEAFSAPREPLLPWLAQTLQQDVDPQVVFAPLYERFGAGLFGPDGQGVAKQAMEILLRSGETQFSYQSDAKDRAQTCGWLLRHMPDDDLLQWDTPADTPGAGLVIRLLQAPWGWKLLGSLSERGIDWTRAQREGDPVAARIGRPAQWKAFLEQGGDPGMAVLHPRTGGTQPLWARLLHKRETQSDKHDIADTMIQWLGRQPHPSPEMKQALGMTRYWSEFAKARPNREGMMGHLFSQSEWTDLHDAQGTPAWAHAVAMVPSTLAGLARHPGGLHAVARRDVHGRSPWFYLLPLLNEQHMPSASELKQLFAALPDAALDAQGRGLLFSLFEAELDPVRLKPRLMALRGRRSQPNLIEHFAPPMQDSSDIYNRLSAEDWVGGTPAQHDALADALLSHARPETRAQHECFQHLMYVVLRLGDEVHERLSPKLKGALLLRAVRQDPLNAMTPHLSGQSRSFQERTDVKKASEVVPLKWLYEGSAEFPEDGVPRLHQAVQQWMAAQGKNTSHPEINQALAERTALMERVILAQALHVEMDAAPATAARARNRM